MKELEESFSDLVDQAYEALLERTVDKNVHSFRSIFLSLNVSRKYLHQKFIQDNLKIDEETTFDDLWMKLAFYWNFLNFDLLEHVINKFRIEDLKQKMESYKDELQSFRKATRLCVFVNCWPLNGEMPPETEFREFVTKIDLDWENCTLEDIETKRRIFIRKFLLPEYALQPGEITKGCIAITWLVPAPFVNDLQKDIKGTTSEFFKKERIITITIDGQECYPTPTRNLVEYSGKQLTSETVTKPEPEIQQSEDPSVSVVPEKLHSFKSRGSKEPAFPKETHRMRLAEEILSGESTSSVPSEKIQFDTQPGETKQDTESSSFLSELKQKQGRRQQTIPSKPPSKYQRMPYTSDSPTLSEIKSYRSSLYSSRDPRGSLFDSPRLHGMEELSLMPKPHTQLGSSKPVLGYSSFTSKDWFEPAEKDIRRGLWVDPPTPAEKYVREKCVDELSRPVKLVPLVEQYLSEAEVKADPSLPTKYKDYLTSTPVIRAALYTTFNAKMAAEVFTWSQHIESPPPTTTTELFTAFTLKTLVDRLSTHPVYHKQQLKVTTFSDLPTDVYKQFQDLCRMAYEGILNRQQLVFSAAHLPTGFASLGLMQEVPQLYTEGRASSYHFIHLTLQEYLAAVHISQLPAHEQTRLFQEHVNSDHFKMTMRFLAGCTKLANILPDITMDTKLNYFHFLFEAKDISMTTRTLGSDGMYVKSHYSWAPMDYYVTGHAISHSNCPWSLNFDSSSIDDEKFELFCQGCAAPGGTGCRGHISYANFSNNDLTSKSIQSFVNIPPHILQNMRELHLSNNKLDGSACDLLAKAVPSMTRLEELWLDRNLIGSGGAVEVIKALCGSGVKELKLWNTGIGGPDCEALCELLKSSHSLQYLDIQLNNISSESVASIITVLSHNNSLTTLKISNSHFSMANVDSLASVLKDHSKCTLTELILQHCHISSEGAVELAAALCKNTTLECLNLSRNPIGEHVEGVTTVAKMLVENKTLTNLYLHHCHISSEGAVELAAALCKNTTLEHIDLSRNPIGQHVEGVTTVAKMLVENKTLTKLYLWDCHISSEGSVELGAALCKNSTLNYLNLDYNPIGVEGASSMSDMLQHNTSLEYLYLCDDSVGEEGVHQLINSLKHNQTLRKLSLPEKYKSETSDHRIQWSWC